MKRLVLIFLFSLVQISITEAFSDLRADQHVFYIGEKISAVSISDLLGQQVYARSCDEDEILVDVTGIPKGIYIIRVNGIVVGKFITAGDIHFKVANRAGKWGYL